ncbi:retrovirus-related pol polyprotein from transposon TNT 1-94 [Tanacetum coccineum]
MTDGDERKHVLDYTHVDLHYVEDQRKNLVSKFNLLKPKISLHKSELSNLKTTVFTNCSLQNEVIRVNLENESLKDEIIDLKKVNEKWTCSKVTLDQLLFEQVLRNIVKSLGGKGRRNEKISSREVVFTKDDESSSTLAPEITSDSESELSPTYVIKKKTEKSLAGPKPCSDKKADSSTEQLLLTLIKEVKVLKRQIEIPSGIPPSSTQPISSKASKQKTWFGPCKHCGFRNHLFDDCYSKPKCSTCGSTNHMTKEHLEHDAVKKTLSNLKAQSPLKPSPKKTPMIPKPFIECKYCGFNDHHSDHYKFYHGCKVNVLRNTPTTGDQGLATGNQNPLKSGFTKGTNLCENIYARLPQEVCPKVVFGDDSLGDTEGYGSVNCNGITFTMVAYVNGLKHNLINISQLYDANYKVLFTKTQGTIYKQNDEVVLITLRIRDVYVIDMSSFNKESNACFFANASPSVNWLWHKRLSHLNFKNINNIAKHNLVSGLPSLTFSKDNNCLACEKGKHHRASFKTKRSFSINNSLHLLHMDLFRPVKPQTISHNKYTLVIVNDYSRKMENLNEVRVKELRSDNGTEFKNHKLEEFCDEKGKAVNTACYTQNRSIIVKRHGKTSYDVFRERSPDISYFHVFGCPVHIHNHKDHLGKFDEKADDGFFPGYSLVAKALRKVMQSTSMKTDPFQMMNSLNQRVKLLTDLFEPAEPQNNVIIELISDVQPSPTISPSAKFILQTLVPQDKWSKEKHIKLVNIIGEPLAGITTRSRIRDSDVASASKCIYVNFLSKMEPKKLIEALEEEGWIIAMQEELN